MLLYDGFEQKVARFVETNPNYKHIAQGLRTSSRSALARDAADDADNAAADQELPIYYRFDVTGHVMVATTEKDEKDVDPAIRNLFQKSVVFMAAVTTAVTRKKKSLYDYDTYQQILGASDFIVSLGIQDRKFQSTDVSLSLDKAIVNFALAAIGNVSEVGTAFSVAQKILDGMSKDLTISASSSSKEKKVGHLLAICQNLMGMPLVNFSLFFVNYNESQTALTSPCSKATANSVAFSFHQDDYMFVDPSYIEQFSKEFQASPQFDALVEKLSKGIA
jgi:hypothetical protein